MSIHNPLDGYINLINAHIIPAFGDKHLDEITRSEIQNYLSALVNEEKYRTAEKLKVQLKAIFDVAVSDYNFKSPMAKVELATSPVSAETIFKSDSTQIISSLPTASALSH